MSHWNHRIFRHKGKEGPTFSLHECYYNEEKKPDGWTKEPISVAHYESVDELIEALEMMLKDAKKSQKDVLDYDATPKP